MNMNDDDEVENGVSSQSSDDSSPKDLLIE